MAQKDEEFAIIEEHFKEIPEGSPPMVEINYQLRNKKTANFWVRVNSKQDQSVDHTIYSIEIMSGKNVTIKIERRFSELKQLENYLRVWYGSETDFGFAGDIEKVEKSFVGFHVLPLLDPCESQSEEFMNKMGLSSEPQEMKIKKRRFKIEHFILKILNNSTLVKSVPWQNFIDNSKSQQTVSTTKKLFDKAASIKDNAVNYLVSFMKDNKEVDSLQLSYKNLKSVAEQMNAQKEILTVCQELVGSNEQTYKNCLEELNTQVWYLEDLFEQVWSIIEAKQKIKSLQDSLNKHKGPKDDIDTINTNIFLRNTEHFFKIEKNIIESNIGEDLNFIIGEFKSIVNAMTNIKQN